MTTTMTNSSGTEIHPGQIWAGRDSRCVGRTVHIDSLDPVTRKAHCHVRTDTGGTPPKSPRTVKILIDRLRPTSTGFILAGCTRHDHCDNRGPAEEPAPTHDPRPRTGGRDPDAVHRPRRARRGTALHPRAGAGDAVRGRTSAQPLPRVPDAAGDPDRRGDGHLHTLPAPGHPHSAVTR